ncbi:YciI family protein [Kitasatospora sp. NPDC059795]|uniref:YciI family protein n=1 Tax=Kitasatospora sp. NPDC059795 TaxID=3346949 RepID=UPI00366528BD
MLQMHFSQSQSDIPPIPDWDPAATAAHIAFMRRSVAELTASGELVEAKGLALPDTARIVRAGEGGPDVVDGPFPAEKEFLFGWWIVDCATDERVLEIAAALSAAPGHDGRPMNMPIEVRELLSEPPVRP